MPRWFSSADDGLYLTLSGETVDTGFRLTERDWNFTDPQQSFSTGTLA
ncbi:MAG: hypothetical protein WD425_11060 [Nitrospirales bacterium]